MLCIRRHDPLRDVRSVSDPHAGGEGAACDKHRPARQHRPPGRERQSHEGQIRLRAGAGGGQRADRKCRSGRPPAVHPTAPAPPRMSRGATRPQPRRRRALGVPPRPVPAPNVRSWRCPAATHLSALNHRPPPDRPCSDTVRDHRLCGVPQWPLDGWTTADVRTAAAQVTSEVGRCGAPSTSTVGAPTTGGLGRASATFVATAIGQLVVRVAGLAPDRRSEVGVPLTPWRGVRRRTAPRPSAAAVISRPCVRRDRRSTRSCRRLPDRRE